MVLNEKRKDILHGILLVALFSCAAFYIGEIPVLEKLSISPLIIGIVFGMLYANSLRGRLPETYLAAWYNTIRFPPFCQRHRKRRNASRNGRCADRMFHHLYRFGGRKNAQNGQRHNSPYFYRKFDMRCGSHSGGRVGTENKTL